MSSVDDEQARLDENRPMAHWLEGAGVMTVGLANHGVGNMDLALGIAELPA